MNNSPLQIISDSEESTRHIGYRLGILLRTGIVLTLSGELGSGKTCLVQGIAKGLDVPEGYYITSPSYTLINEYPGRIPLVHADLYRIEDPVDLFDIGLSDYLGGESVVAIEWPDRLDDLSLTEYISIDMTFINDYSRKIVFTAYGLKATDLLKEFGCI